jgi:hypothetical protein
MTRADGKVDRALVAFFANQQIVSMSTIENLAIRPPADELGTYLANPVLKKPAKC